MTTSTLERIMQAAAEARGAGTRGLRDRPSQRRCSEQPGSAPVARVRAQAMQIRAAEQQGQLHFEGFASVYARGYDMWDMFGPYSEQVSPGAGAVSLSRADLDVPLVLAHDSLRRVARTTNGSLTLDERTVDDVQGLYVDAPMLDARDSDVAYIAPKLESGLIDEMSFRFVIERGSWSPDWDTFAIEQYDIHRGDVAIVGYGANPFTAGAGLRSLPSLDDLTDAQLRSLENDLHARRQVRGDAADTPDATPKLSRLQIEALSALL